MRANFIGCGKLGKTLAKLFVTHQVIQIAGIFNTSAESTRLAIQFIGQGKACATWQDLPEADIYFITTPDDAIELTCMHLIAESKIPKGAIIVHCSGSLPSSILNSAKQKDCHIASIHPIKSFANPELCLHHFAGTYCSYEGDDKAIQLIKKLFTAIGGILFEIQSHEKTLYHIGGTLSNNYLIALHYSATECYQKSGIPEEIAQKIVTSLMNDALQNITASNHISALTGPLQRGDTKTIKKHMDVLQALPALRNVYQSLGKIALTLTRHTEKIKREILSSLRA